MSEQKDIGRRKIKVNVGNPLPGDDRINRHKNFESLMGNYEVAAKQLHRKPLYKNPRIFLGVVLVIVIGVLVWRAVEEERWIEHGRSKAREGAVVRPPLPEAVPPFSQLNFKLEENSRLDLGDGVIMQIPAFAFGEMTGEARLEYRVLGEAREIFASGIRLVSDTNRKAHLSSLALLDFEIYALGKPLKLQSGKTIEIHLISQNDPSAVQNLYFLNPNSQSWELSPQLPVASVDSLEISDSLALQLVFRIDHSGVWNIGNQLADDGLPSYKLRFQDETEADLGLKGEVAVIMPEKKTVIYSLINEEGEFFVKLSPDYPQILAGISENGTLRVIYGSSLMEQLDWSQPEALQILKMRSFTEIKDWNGLQQALLEYPEP
ncbi:MAG: hypothetical protein H6581_09805 [Bacteroidia bacterium]|nr:hypothetical protein [Bacteroidia bacterium]